MLGFKLTHASKGTSWHYNDVIMGLVVSQITRLTVVYWTVYSGAYQRKSQSSASLAFVRGIHWWSVNSPHKWPVCFHLMTSCLHFPFYPLVYICNLYIYLFEHDENKTYVWQDYFCLLVFRFFWGIFCQIAFGKLANRETSVILQFNTKCQVHWQRQH